MNATRLAKFLAPAALLMAASVASAGPPTARTVAPPQGNLPVFGMSTYNNGYGERVVNVAYGSRAWQMGIEPGDTIVRLNGHQLNYHGSWHNALTHAMYNGGHVDLAIRDVRTGRTVFRHADFGYNNGPITPKVAVVGGGFNDHGHHGGGMHNPPTQKVYKPNNFHNQPTTTLRLSPLAELARVIANEID